jgi:hypothetical protein
MKPFGTTVRLPVPAAVNPRQPTYLARVATFDERTLFEATLAAPPWSAGRVFDFQLLDALEAAASDRMADAPPEDQQRLADAFETARRAPGGLDQSQRVLIAELEKIEEQAPGRYSELVAARRRRAVALPTLALRWFLAGWEDRDEPFATRPEDGRISDAALQSIPEAERLWLGIKLYAMLYPSAIEGKPLPSSPSSPPARQTSRGGGGRRTAGRAGKSPARSTPKTRG